MIHSFAEYSILVSYLADYVVVIQILLHMYTCKFNAFTYKDVIPCYLARPFCNLERSLS